MQEQVTIELLDEQGGTGDYPETPGGFR